MATDNILFESNIPSDLKTFPHWVLWKLETRDGKATKVPYSPITCNRASTTDSATWASYDQALTRYQQNHDQFSGMGFVFSDNDPFTGIDLDKCLDADGNLESWAADIVRDLDSYTEISPSGAGLHVVVTAVAPAGGSRKGRFELYDRARYFTVTGRHYDGTPFSINPRQHELAAVHRQIFAKPEREPDPKPAHSGVVHLDDSELLERICKGRAGADFEALWRGDIATWGDDHSSADLALCGHLAWWTEGDVDRIDRLFRQSGLMRPKWDQRHYSDGRTYGQGTISKACASVGEGYTGRSDRPSGFTTPVGAKREASKPLIVDAKTLLKNPRSPDWLIKHWISRYSLILLFGDPGSGKTFLLLDWMLSIATGLDWNGCRVKPGKVLYICGESPHGIPRRLAAWTLQHGDFPDDRFFIVQRSILMNTEGVDAILREVDAFGGVDIIGVDTLARTIDGDENKAEDMGAFITACDTLKEVFNCAIVVNHHCGHGDKERGRGHSSLKGSLDSEFRLEFDKETSVGRLSCTKSKDSDPPKPMAFKLDVVDLPEMWDDEDGEPTTSLVFCPIGDAPRRARKLTAGERIALDALRVTIEQGGVQRDLGKHPGWRARCAEHDQWRECAFSMGMRNPDNAPSSARMAFKRAREALLGDKTIGCDGGYYWILGSEQA